MKATGEILYILKSCIENSLNLVEEYYEPGETDKLMRAMKFIDDCRAEKYLILAIGANDDVEGYVNIRTETLLYDLSPSHRATPFTSIDADELVDRLKAIYPKTKKIKTSTPKPLFMERI